MVEPLTATRLDFSDYRKKFSASIAICAELVRRYKWNPEIRTAALKILRGAGVAARDKMAEIYAIYKYVRDVVQFRNDVNDIETLQTPVYTLQMNAGDCDDKVTLLASLLEAVGYKTRFATISQNAAGAMSHIYTQVQLPDQSWLNLETVRPVAIGTAPENFTRRAFYAY
jgi:transglutaminase-like putative cysteine protease